MVAELVDPRGWFSVLRYRADATRDEARNVAVLLVSREGQFGGMKAGPVSSISPRLHEQGIVDSVLVALQSRFRNPDHPKLTDLTVLQQQLERSLVLTEPKPVLVPDVDVTLNALYRAYVAPVYGGRAQATKGAVLDRVITQLRKQGRQVRRGQYVRDFIFDVVFDDEPQVAEVLSFATQRRKWEDVENDAAHFLYGLERVREVQGSAILKAPDGLTASPAADESYRRVRNWMIDADVPVQDLHELVPAPHAPAQEQIAW